MCLSPRAQTPWPAPVYLDGIVLLVELFWVREIPGSASSETQGGAGELAQAVMRKLRSKPRSLRVLGGPLQVAPPPGLSRLFPKGFLTDPLGIRAALPSDQLCADSPELASQAAGKRLSLLRMSKPWLPPSCRRRLALHFSDQGGSFPHWGSR